MPPEEKGYNGSTKGLPLLFRLPTPVAIVALILAVCTPGAGLAVSRNHAGLAISMGVAVVAGYMLLRWGWGPNKRESFGPLWLEMVDMGIVFGNIFVILFACWRALAQTIWGS